MTWSRTYGYDGFGNRDELNGNPVLPVDTATNRILDYTYDANGNVTVMPKPGVDDTLTWDVLNRLTQFSGDGGTEEVSDLRREMEKTMVECFGLFREEESMKAGLDAIRRVAAHHPAPEGLGTLRPESLAPAWLRIPKIRHLEQHASGGTRHVSGAHRV